MTVKSRLDIFGNQIMEVTDTHGQDIANIKISTDIFGNVYKVATDHHGTEILSVRVSKDIFGKESSLVSTNLKPEQQTFYLNLINGQY